MAVYGRRRVGKTFLIKTFFKEKNVLFFSASGIKKASFSNQRNAFCQRIADTFYNGAPLQTPKTWLETFQLLQQAISQTHAKKVVIFIDELPWLNTPRSKLLGSLEYYWNEYWAHQGNIKLIVCGSLSSWIIKNIINDTGGFYNRVTYRLQVEPFNLHQTRGFLKAKHIKLTNDHILSLYMAMGGIPLYLEQATKGKTAEEIIDEVCFCKEGLLYDEIKELFAALFTSSKQYVDITREIAKHRYGISRKILAKNLKLSVSGRLTERLEELEDTGYISSYLPYGHEQRGLYYKISDEYTYFYFKWIEPYLKQIKQFKKPQKFWLERTTEPSYWSWKGYAFESICFKHLDQIRTALNLKTDAAAYSWRYTSKPNSNDMGSQIDMLFDRMDNAITLFEIKCTQNPFTIDKTTMKSIDQKIDIFKSKTNTKKQIFVVLISANGIKKNHYSEAYLDDVISLADMFKRDTN